MHSYSYQFSEVVTCPRENLSSWWRSFIDIKDGEGLKSVLSILTRSLPTISSTECPELDQQGLIIACF